MIFALSLALTAQTAWQLVPGPGVAVSQGETITALGGGIATLQLPNTNGSWRMSFDVRASKSAGGKQDIALLGSETLFRMHFENADAAYATLARGEKGLNVPVGDTWRRVQIYDIRGCLSFRYERKIMGAMMLSEAPTSFVVGVQKVISAAAPGEVQIKDLAFAPVDDSLTGVARDVPVPTLSSYKSEPLIPRPFDVSAKPDLAVAANGTLTLLGSNIDLTCPSGANISLTPAAPANPQFPVTGVGIAMDGQLLQETALKAGQSVPHFDYRLPSGNGGIHNFRFIIEDQAKDETAIQYVHVTNDDFVAKHLQAQTDENGCHITVSDIPATSLMLYSRGIFLGSVKLANGQVSIPAELVPGGDAHWTAIAKDDSNRLWGPLPFDISSHRTTFKGSVVRSDWDPAVSEATFTVSPSTSAKPAPKSMEVFADGALVQSGPLKEINRTVLLSPGQNDATVRVQYTLADGSTVWGGTARIQTPEDMNLSTVTAADSGSIVLVQTLTDGWKSVESGFFFGSGRLVATTAGVLQGQQAVRVITTAGEVLPVENIVLDQVNGVAVLKLARDSGHQPLTASRLAGKSAYVLQSKALPDGAMAHDNLVLPVANLATSDAGYTFPGQLIFNDVGAPVVDDKGQVLGIVVRTSVPGTTIRNMAVYIAAVTKLAQSAS
jgi:Trypsin-like peptidase domain